MNQEQEIKKISKEDFEYLCENMVFFTTLVQLDNDNYEIIDEPELTAAIKKFRNAVKEFEKESSYKISFIDIKKVNK